MKSKRSKATDIPKKVKDEVWERDDHCCVICGTPSAMPNCHYISRHNGGLGIPQNIVTACCKCHDDYDFGDRETTETIQITIREHLMNFYADWNESKLYYRKGQSYAK